MTSSVQMAAFADEMEKIALDEKTKHRLKVTGGVLGGSLLAAGGIVAARPALRRHLMADLKAFGVRGGSHAVDRAKSLPKEAVEQAREVANFLRSKGVDPSKARIAVSGTGGTGKTTLARGLAEELQMKPLMLDDVGKSISGRDIPKWLKGNGHVLKPGTIAEQTHLTNQVDPDKFDVIIHVKKPMDRVKNQIIKRGRGAGQLEVYDYDKLDRTITTGFKHIAGDVHTPVEGVNIKLRPTGGFKANQMLNSELRAKGISPGGMDRQAKVYTLATGSKPDLPGILPYVRKGHLAAGVGIVGTGGAAGGYAAHRYGQRKET